MTPMRIAALCLLSAAVPLAAQTAAPRFDVVSVKVALPPPRVAAAFQFEPARLTGTRVTLMMLLAEAYAMQPARMVGLPDWARTDRFDIVATAAAPVSRDQMLAMLRSLLAERFQLAAHLETRETKVYAMTVAKGGLKVPESKEGSECQTCRLPRAPMSNIADLMASIAGMPVMDPETKAVMFGEQLPGVDETGLKGFYDVDFRPSPAGDPKHEMEEKLGLKVEARKLPLELLIVDHAAKPSAN
jgi:uncharacterized protein (TIGR03435 family)